MHGWIFFNLQVCVISQSSSVFWKPRVKHQWDFIHACWHYEASPGSWDSHQRIAGRGFGSTNCSFISTQQLNDAASKWWQQGDSASLPHATSRRHHSGKRSSWLPPQGATSWQTLTTATLGDSSFPARPLALSRSNPSSIFFFPQSGTSGSSQFAVYWRISALCEVINAEHW